MGSATGSGATAQVLSLRRLAEVEAQRQMRAARAQLEQRRLRLEQARLRLRDSEQALGTARAAARQRDSGSLPAAELQRQADELRLRAEAVRQGLAMVAGCESEVVAALQALEACRAEWLKCRARREAAELHEELERREQRRMRAGRERAHEDEARDRFAIARSK